MSNNPEIKELMRNSCVPMVASVSLRRRARGRLHENYML